MRRRRRRLPWVRGRAPEDETELEIRVHLEMRVEELVARGLREEEARAAAVARFGNLDEARRKIAAAARRRDRRLSWTDRLDELRRDGQLALRRMRANPAHALLATAIFGVGIGLTTVMFAFVDNVLLRPLPFPEPDRLVALLSVPENGPPFGSVSMGNWYDWRRDTRTLSATALHSQESRAVTVASDGGAYTVPGVTVHGAFFETLRPRMAAGRAPTEADAEADERLVVVSEAFWRSRLGSAPLAPAPELLLDASRYTVVGVLAEGFEHPQETQLWIPAPTRPQTGGSRNNINFLAIGRLHDDATITQAEADLSSIAEGIRATDPSALYSYGVGVRSLEEIVVGDADEYLAILMGAVALVLLIACANLASLGFARGTDRAEEISLRRSLGATRGRLVRQLLTEEIALAALGGALGVLLAWWGTSELVAQVRDVLPRSRTLAFDARIVGFGVLVSLLAGVCAGLPPALRASRSGPARGLAGSRTVRGGRGLPGRLLVAGEVALTVLLLTGGGLLLMSFRALAARDLGFDPRDVATVDIALTSPDYREEERVVAYWERLLGELEALASVESVGMGLWIPTGGGGTGFIEVDGGGDGTEGAGYRIVGGDYFAALRTPLLQGRSFEDRDRLDTELVTVVNQAMADRYWPGTNPIGQRVRALSMEGYYFGGEAPWRTVVGVVGDVRHFGFESEPTPEMYVPFRQLPWRLRAMAVVARLRPPTGAEALAELGVTAAALDPSLAVRVSSLDDRLARLLTERRMTTALLAAFALAALGLAALGVYGVLSHSVARRTREMAIRSALGARRDRLVRMVLWEAGRVVAIGAAVGLTLAVGLHGVLDALLTDVTSADPRAYAAALACLLLVSSLAALVPAWRATRMDPLEALREG